MGESVADESGRHFVKNPIWYYCSQCEDFLCSLHDKHVYECPCPPIEEWDVDPYSCTDWRK
jgi:hypothetical protein